MDGGTAMKGIFVRVYPQGVLHKVCWQGQTAMVPTDTGAPDRVRAWSTLLEPPDMAGGRGDGSQTPKRWLPASTPS